MELYDKLSKVYSTEHLSISRTQTVIEETDSGAETKEVIIEHTGTEVMKISKNLLVEVRDSIPNNPYPKVCDGMIGVDVKDKFIGYFELKSACTRNNVVKAKSQILDSFHHFRTAASSFDLTEYQEKGIIVTQPITDEERVKNQKRINRDDDMGIKFSTSRFLRKLLKGNAIIEDIDMPLLHYNAGQIILLADLLKTKT